ncbi:serine/threonine protein phosphatase [Candidatus Bathyarchaeota archaeon]|nr:serine/threonine protein phosphatase [Candidatus Bathyarchaeota archaeon]
MDPTIKQVVKEALEATCENFCKITEEARRLICSENGKIGVFEVFGRLVKLQPANEALIVGDLHGDLESLIDILNGSGFIQKMRQSPDSVMVFLGDYGDRGAYSAEVYYTILKLKLFFPKQIILMRGNHEGPEDLMASPHDLPWQFQSRFGAEWEKAYNKIRELFKGLYNAVFVERRCLMIHGGLSPNMKTIEDLAYAHNKHPKERLLEDMLWSDPTEMVDEFCASPRGAGKLFSAKVTRQVLERFNVKLLIRGHEPCVEGYKIDHDGKILTLFSRKGAPYFNAYGAYLIVKVSEQFQSVKDLIPHIRKF